MLECLFFCIDQELTKDKSIGQKYKQDKDRAFEKKS